MAFLAEQAGGKASDGKERILDIIPEACTSVVLSSSATTIWLKTSRTFKEFPDA
jgi:fructose-1,6-bisphosphatase I